MLNIFESEERQHSPSVFQLQGKSRAARIYDFCYLSNKFFPTEEIVDQLKECLTSGIRNYPSMQREQCKLASALTGYSADRILVGNGASELIHLLAARIGQNWLMPYPSYMEYENVIRDFDKEIHFFPLKEENDFRVDLSQIRAEIERRDIDAFVLPNPNSPTGQRLDLNELFELLDVTSGLKAVVIDESFIEFSALERDDIPTLRSFLDRYRNLIIIRSLGKDFGVCGLRLGLVATANEARLEEVRRHLPIWNVSPLAEMFLRICVDRVDEYEEGRKKCISETRWLVDELRKLPQLRVFDTYSNFILVRLDAESGTNSVELRDYLLEEHGLYVRDCSRKLGLSDQYLRIGANVREANDLLVRSIATFFNS